MIIVFGVSGCGKTTIGKQLANQLAIPFYDADNFHPDANVQKMSNGLALNDEDRYPWLSILAKNIKDWTINGQAVLACSALKESYRKQLAKNNKAITWVYLNGTYQIIEDRIKKRTNHFMQSDLLKSQFEALEVPNYGIHVNIDQTPEQIIKTIRTQLSV